MCAAELAPCKSHLLQHANFVSCLMIECTDRSDGRDNIWGEIESSSVRQIHLLTRIVGKQRIHDSIPLLNEVVTTVLLCQRNAKWNFKW